MKGKYFNSQPHKKADGNTVYHNRDLWDISTHSLTRRLTFHELNLDWLLEISTHSLTRRLTLKLVSICNPY